MYVISYDISNDKVRSKVAKSLEGYGRRVQHSVFECNLNKKQYEELHSKLRLLASLDESSNIRFYTICANCTDKLSFIGDDSTPDYSKQDVIVV